MAIEIKRWDDDSSDFIAEVHSCVSGVLDLHKPAELILINVDNWFGQRWLHFCGKVCGAAGVHSSSRNPFLTVPPFVPHRIRSEHRFVAPRYIEVLDRKPIHRNVESQIALNRRMHEVAPGASIIWYSGGTRRTGRGSIMAYLLCDSAYWTWYAELSESESSWHLVTAKGINEQEFSLLKRPKSIRL
jgi:hypothetical protein